MKKKMKKRYIVLIVFLVLILTIAAIIMVPIWIRKNNEKKLLESQTVISESLSVKDLKKKLTDEEKQADYSNDGMTNIDKINRGLSIYSDDTDGDGLRDVDEINTYKSDPLKYSTAGDLYSDYYKVQNNLNVKKKIKGAPNIDVGIENIKLTPKTAIDEKASYEEYNGKVPSDYNVIEKPFIINGFSGEIKYTLKEQAKNCEVYSYDRLSNKVNKISSKAKDNDIIFKNDDGKPIFITYKKSYIKNVTKGKINAELKYDNSNEEVEEEKQYYVVMSFISNLIFGKPIRVYEYTSSPTKLIESSDVAFENKVNEALNQFLKKNLSNDEYEFSQKTKLFNINIKHHYIGNAMMEILENLSDELDVDILNENPQNIADIGRMIKSLFFKVYKVKGTRQDMINAVFEDELNEYLGYQVANNETDKKQETFGGVLADSGFDLTKNSFHFSNVGTKFSEEGVCAGMSYIVSNAYNNKSITDKFDQVPENNPFGDFFPTYDISDKAVFGCITNDNAIGNYNMGRILESYSNASPDDDFTNYTIKKGLFGLFGKKQVISTELNLEENDIKLIRAIEYYWAYMNTMKYMPQIEVENLINDSSRRSKFSEIESLIKYIGEGKVAMCDIFSENGNHSINVYKVEQDSNDPDIYYLSCYDNNFPLDTYIKNTDNGYIREKIENVRIKVVRHRMKSGEDTFDYSYDIFNNEGYRFKSQNDTRILFYTSEMELIK